MKKLSFGVFLFAIICVFYACNGSSSTGSATTSDSTTASATDSMDSSKMKTDTTTNNAGNQVIDQKTKDFVADAETGGMTEVELGNMAIQKGKSQQVKDFGKMMVDDHTKADNDLKDIATKKNIDVPAAITDDQRKDVDKLSKKSGADFDKAYVNMMVDGHKKVIDAFKKASNDVTDNDIKNFITNTLPTIQKHLDSIQSIKAKM